MNCARKQGPAAGPEATGCYQNSRVMIINLCLACRRVNALEALFCRACGADLADDGTAPALVSETLSGVGDLARGAIPRPAPVLTEEIVLTGVPLPSAADGLPAVTAAPASSAVGRGHGRSIGPGAAAPAGALDVAPAAGFAAPAADAPADGLADAANPANAGTAGTAGTAGPADAVAGQAPGTPTAVLPVGLAAPVLVTRRVAAQRPQTVAAQPWPGHERRTRARRVRWHGASAAERTAARLAEVIVLDADTAAREHLCAVLRDLGFGLHVVAEPAQALSLVVRRPLAAAFMDVALDAADGGAGVALCRHVRQAARRADGGATVLVLLRAELRPIDRVQADLAGCDDAIAKPVTRGGIVRVLEARGIVLPTEAPKV